MLLQMTEGEICRSYHWAKDKVNQILILSQMNLVSKSDITEILKKNGEQLPTRKKRLNNRTTSLSDKRAQAKRECALKYHNEHKEECNEKSRQYYRDNLMDNPEYKSKKAEYDRKRYEKKKKAKYVPLVDEFLAGNDEKIEFKFDTIKEAVLCYNSIYGSERLKGKIYTYRRGCSVFVERGNW